MRNLSALLPIALLAATPAAAQSFQPAVATTNLPPLEALWHLRAALNVAALGCRDADEAITVASYNTLIRNAAPTLTAANDAVSARYKAQYGANWESARERDMTKLYNFFAQPTAARDFCSAAKTTLAQIQNVGPQDLPGFALAALPMLEAPFDAPARVEPQFASAPANNIVAISAAIPVAPPGAH
ncbi:MAG: hypothetical protein V4459_04815 [Pseudomonadota bacterium]